MSPLQQRLLADRLASRQVELAALRAVASNVNLFTDPQVAEHLQAAILAAHRAVQEAEA
jgi:hypothetical protein